jgi:formylglycine-generating enzyme required for sulfatase activity
MLPANAFGVYDMIGNVAEWVLECHGEDCDRRMVKGGSWGSVAHHLRIAERVPYPVTHRDDSVGFRVARTLDH